MTKTRVTAEFMIQGVNLVPELVTRRLKVDPTTQYAKGDEWGSEGKKRASSSWQLSTGEKESDDIDLQLLELYDKLKDKEDALIQLREEHELEYQIRVVLRVEDGRKPAIRFDHWFIEFTHAITAQVVIDLYC